MKNINAAWLEAITKEEQKKLIQYMSKQLIVYALVCIPVCIISILGIMHINKGANILTLSETERSAYNIILVVAGILCLRLFIGQIISFLKEKKGWQKKVMIKEVLHINNKSIRFKDDETTYKMLQPFKLNTGDKVEISTAEKLPVILSVKKRDI